MGAAPTARPSSSASSSGRATSIPRSSRTARSPSSRASSAAGSTSAIGHFRVDHARDEFAKGTVHINGIEGFWGLAKVRLTQFKGLPKHTFHLHLKETEWRYNHRRADKYKWRWCADAGRPTRFKPSSPSPAASPSAPMFRRGPLTFADDGQSGAVNDEVPAGARAGAPKREGEMLTASRERGVIGCREIEQPLEDMA